MDGKFDIPGFAPGRLAIGAHPNPRDLRGAIAALAQGGVTDVVTLLSLSDTMTLGLGQEETFCDAHGIALHRHEIADFGLPTRVAFLDLVAFLSARLAAGASVFVHCRAGIGRSGILASALLMQSGMRASAAIETVSAARGVPVPDTEGQADFIRSLDRGQGTG